MNLEEVMKQLESYGNEQKKKIYKNHGAKEPLFGVKVGDLKKIVKKIKHNQSLAEELFATGNSDAMYLAGLIAEPEKFTKELLNEWINKAYWYMLSEYVVASIAAESKFAWEIGLEWIESKNQYISAGGWSTLSNYISITSDEKIDFEKIKTLLVLIKNNIHNERNRVKYTMNNFVISVGTYLVSLREYALNIAEGIGKVEVFMGKTSCKTPIAKDYIIKAAEKNQTGKKRKKAMC